MLFIYLFYMGIGDWGLGIGDWGLGPIPNPQFITNYIQKLLQLLNFKLYFFKIIFIK